MGAGTEPPAERLHAPHLLDVEVVDALRRHVRLRELAAKDAAEALAALPELPIERYPHEGLVEAMWALRRGMTAYDAAYVALAVLLAVPLVTCDRRLARAARRYVDVVVPD